MRRIILGVVVAMLCVPSIARAGSIHDNTHGSFDNPVRNAGFAEPISCSAGDAPSLLVGAAALGLVLRRRR
jgi:MYXO-CTERM domain-containing protein